MVSASDGASWMLLVTRERKRDDREEEKKTQREAKEREIPVGMNTIDVHGDVFVAASSAKTTEAGGGCSWGRRSVELELKLSVIASARSGAPLEGDDLPVLAF